VGRLGSATAYGTAPNEGRRLPRRRVTFAVVTSIRVQRPHDGGGMLRRLVVDLDGQQVAALKQGESVDLPVSAGTYAVAGRMDWTRSPALEVEIAEGQQVRVEVALPMSALWNMTRRPRSALSIRRF
jgi:hypothetical protein